MSEWKPIETAPKDGTKLLLLEEECCVEGGYFPENKDSWCPQVIELSDNWVNCYGEIIEPSHWMELPEPPKKRHKCSYESLTCIRDNKGCLRLIHNNFSYPVSHCPFCGEPGGKYE